MIRRNRAMLSRLKHGRGIRRARGSFWKAAAALGTTVALFALSSAPALAAPAPPTPPPPLVTDPAALVNPFIGTGSGGNVVGQVDLFPGAAAPFGMLTFSPDTPSRPDGGGYNYSDSSILGFSLTHISGPGCSAYGDVPILPTVGAIGSNPVATTDPFNHTDETATPGYYGVTLNPGTANAIETQLSATTRTGISDFTFPSTKQANLLFKVGDSANGNEAADVHIVGNDEVTGTETSGNFCGSPGTYTLHFVALFNRPFSSYGTWNGSTVSPASRVAQHQGPPTPPTPAGPNGQPLPPLTGNPSQAPLATPKQAVPGTEAKGSQSRTQVPGTSGPTSGAWVTFNTSAPGPAPVSGPAQQVKMKVAISYVSTANAMQNLKAEDPGWSLNAVRQATHQEWNTLLNRIQVRGGTHSQQVQFYTALYHAMLDPNVFSDVNGQYMGFDDKVHQLPPGQIQYANFSGWDIYRSEVPLLATLVPHRTSQMITSLLNDQSQGGWLPKWEFANDYTGVMNGDSADPIIADAYAFGARDFNAQEALGAMIKGASDIPTSVSQLGQGWYEERPGLSQYLQDGYVPGDASETLEYATDDFGIARLAKEIGDMSVYKTYLARSQNWQNLFDTAAIYQGQKGFIEPRNANGSFPSGPAFQVTPNSFGQAGFQEGNAAQYTWMVPQDLSGLFSAMGGNATVIQRLNTLFTHLNVGPNEPYYWAGNEPGLGIPWEYDYAGAPYLTQSTVHRIITSVYSDTPGGEPGNDDLGAMSSWYVWACLGLYPETPGAPVLDLGAPIFPQVQFNLDNGHSVVLSAPGATTSTYVQSLNVNGHASNDDWLPASLITGPATTSQNPGPTPPAPPPGPGANQTILTFTMGANPNTNWANATTNEPPSYPAGPVKLPSNAYLSASPTPAGVSPGKSTTDTVQLNNSMGTNPVTVTWTATSNASGLTLNPTSGTLTAAAGQSATVPLTISASASAAKGYDDITVAATSANGSNLPSLILPVAVAPSSSILRQFNNIGIADFTNPGCANFDGQQGGYSQSTLNAAGLSPGASVTADGATFTWPNVSVCNPDNVQANGQTIPVTHTLSGATSLAFLGAGGDGNSQGPVTVHYTNGTSTTENLGFSDWALGANSETPQYGNSIVANMPYRYEGGSYQKLEMYMFATLIPINPDKTVASVTLPMASDVSGGSLHVFAVAESDQVVPVPTISSISPTSAGAGDIVTLTGTNFGTSQGSGFVHFADNGTNWGEPQNDATFKVDSWSNTSVTFTVPVPSGPNNEWVVEPNTTATVTVTNSNGQTSNEVSLAIT